MACIFALIIGLYFVFQLSNTKAQDGKTTLLHFVANVIETKHPEILYFNEEISHVDKASRGKCQNLLFVLSVLLKLVETLYHSKHIKNLITVHT